MKLRYDPFPLIFDQGDAATQLVCLVFFRLGDTFRALRCLLELLRDQHANGTFPSQFDREQWGMQETVRHTLLLLETGLPAGGVNVASAVRFILDQQRYNGGWSENPSLAIPPERTWLSAERSITWLTADVVDLLHQVGLGGAKECGAAVAWLRTMQTRQGAWPSLGLQVEDRPGVTGDPDATAQIGFLLGELFGEEDPAYVKARDLFEGYLDECALDVSRGYRIRLRDGGREEPEVYHLTHLLLSWLLDPPRRFQRGYDVRDPRIQHMMEALLDLQRDDGGWRPFWAAESSPVYTAVALKTLVLSGALAREELQPRVQEFVT